MGNGKIKPSRQKFSASNLPHLSPCCVPLIAKPAARSFGPDNDAYAYDLSPFRMRAISRTPSFLLMLSRLS